MIKPGNFRALLLASASIVSATHAYAGSFDIPSGDLQSALKAYSAQSGVPVVVSDATIKGARTKGIKGELPADQALSRILRGTGFTISRDPSGVIAIVPLGASNDSSDIQLQPMHLAQAAPARAAVETVTVTSSKLGGADVQSIPIAITALSQEQLTSTQTAGGPDLVKQVPNLTFTKTNFTGYSINIRGIGTQAISVTTDPAVAVAFNDTPFIRNHFFEQEFYDVAQVEVLRGPQGTLYGRNATAGVVNVTSAKPTDQFEAMASADIGNYKNRRFEAMLNIPFVSDKLDLRVAGEWTKRDGYSFNSITNAPIDGRDLWSGRASLRWKPVENATVDFIWEHFSEDDDRIRSSKQLCKRDNYPKEILGVSTKAAAGAGIGESYLNQGCVPVSLYSPEAFQVPDANMLPYYGGLVGNGFGLSQDWPGQLPFVGYDPYASTTQSRDLRVIESAINPDYRAKNDTVELNAQWNVTSALTFYSDTGYNSDFLWSAEDYNRFNTSPGVFSATVGPVFGYYPEIIPDGNYDCAVYDSVGNPHFSSYSVGAPCPASDLSVPTGIWCDPQLGCSDRFVAEDLSEEHAWQLSQEVRLASNFSGPLNFSAGGNFLHYETEENYYVFINTLTVYMLDNQAPSRNPDGTLDSTINCLQSYAYPPFTDTGVGPCAGGYIDPNPIGKLDNQGHNYFLSQNPYVLNSYAGFGEAYYNVTPDLKLTAGLRWTDDQKHFVNIPSQLLIGTPGGYGYPIAGSVDQSWQQWTGRFVANWSPKLDFTDQSMFYGSYARGYKAGGANPPGAQFPTQFGGGVNAAPGAIISTPVHPLTFAPEFVNAFELGTKNSALDGSVTLNGDVFFYDYKGYQISEIVDRTAINSNFDATVRGAEIEATWEALPGLKFGFAGGYEATRIDNGQSAVDLMDRTAGHAGWYLVKPFVTNASNCVLPAYVLAYQLSIGNPYNIVQFCGSAYNAHTDPVTDLPYTAFPTHNNLGTPIDPSYPGFDPDAGGIDPLTGLPDPYTGQNTYNGVDYGPAPNNGEGFSKKLGGHELPNAPHFTASFTTDYSIPLSADWAATLHGDFYWQSEQWARVFNDDPYDRIRGYTNVNFALILTDTSGWQVMGYLKNVFNTTAITGDFLNSDDSGLTTNIFLTDPRLFGVRVTKRFDGGSSGGLDFLSGDRAPQVWVQLGGNFAQLADGWEHYNPSFLSLTPPGLPSLLPTQKAPAAGFDWEGKLSLQPQDSDWVLKAGIRYGRSSTRKKLHKEQAQPSVTFVSHPTAKYCQKYNGMNTCTITKTFNPNRTEVVDGQATSSEQHVMLDFTLGKDVGLGSAGTGTLGAGVREAQLHTNAHADFKLQPAVLFPYLTSNGSVTDLFDGVSDERRSFHGIGPEATWDAEHPLLGTPETGEISLDWGVNAALLFGRQRANLRRTTTDIHCDREENTCPPYGTPPLKIITTDNITRSRGVTVPNLGGYIGASMRYLNGKVSLGYRADTFFNAMDGGQDTAKDYNRGFYGPYLNVSLGL